MNTQVQVAEAAKVSVQASELVSIATEFSQAHELARTSMDFLDALARPDAHEYDYPPTFIAVWQWLTQYIHKQRDFSKLALGLPRGFGKSSVLKLFILYTILFTDRQFILVLAANQKLAENILADVIDMLDSDNIKNLFGDWRIGLEKDTQSLYKFGFRGRNIILAALGQGSSVRGLNLKNARPDLMIFDDVQTREDADSEVASTAIETWMQGTAMKAKSPKGCLYIFVANMYPTEYSLLRKLKRNPTWIKFIAGGILADGTSLWEELQPVSQLLEEYESDLAAGHPEIFHAEVLNDENANVNTALDISKIPQYNYDEYELSAGSFVIIDPATDKANADAVAIGAFILIDGKPVAREILNSRFSPSEQATEALRLAVKWGASLVLVESVAYQYTLIHWIDQFKLGMGLHGIRVEPIYPGGGSKNSRIRAMFKSLLAGEVLLHPECRSLVLNQASQFNPLKTNNKDDILDLLVFALRVPMEFGSLLTLNAAYSLINIPEVAMEDRSYF